MKDLLPPSELIVNPDGSIYHLNLRPEDVGDYIITVGDPKRVARVSQHFNEVSAVSGTECHVELAALPERV